MYLNVLKVESALVVSSVVNAGFTELIELPHPTWEERRCQAIKIGKGSGSGRIAVMLLGGLHADEWGSSDILINFVEQVTDAYRTGSGLDIGSKSFSAQQLKLIVELLDIVVFPQANPDGRAFSMEGGSNSDWRKNRRTKDPSSDSCPGVDLNRNFDFLWDFTRYFDTQSGVHSSIWPCEPENYIGHKVESEPETKNVVWLLDRFLATQFFVDVHSSGEKILYSWGNDDNQSTDKSMNFRNAAFDGQRGADHDNYGEYIPPEDEARAIALADAMAEAIRSVRGRSYEVWQSKKGAYPVSGASTDYAYSRHFTDETREKIYAHVIEWGSNQNPPEPSHPIYSEMRQIIDEVTAGLVQLCIEAAASVKKCFLVIERSTYSQDEVLAAHPTDTKPAEFDPAFWVVVEGFTTDELGLTTDNLDEPPTALTVTIETLSSQSGMSVHSTGPVIPEDPSLPARPQRFRYQCQMSFASDAVFNFPGASKDMQVGASVTAAGKTATAAGVLRLFKREANPFMLDGPTWWLSVDLRVFTVRLPEARFGQLLFADPNTFIESVIDELNDGGGVAGGESFDELPEDEAGSRLELTPIDATYRLVYNFALARVRMRGLTQDAPDTRVFFRLMQAQSTNTSYDQSTVYRRFPMGTPGGRTIALPGIRGGEYVSVPFFAAPRVDTAVESMIKQTDPKNVRTIKPDPGGNEVEAYFGCLLDINHPSDKILPQTPPTQVDGPFRFQSVTLRSLQEAIVRSPHQCLVAEIAFDPATIPPGVDPTTTDKLAQRNLAWVSIPNPGDDGSRCAPQTFEIASTPTFSAEPTELMIDWDGLPAGSTAQVYLPTVDADAVLALADRTVGRSRLQRIDAHTLACAAETVTYLPIPPSLRGDHAGLLTVEVPAGVRRGQQFTVRVRQLTPTKVNRQVPDLTAVGGGEQLLRWDRVDGAFQIDIPVRTKAELLPIELRLLSVLRWIARDIPASSRWSPVFVRYLAQIAERVRGLGGNPDTVLPSPTGQGSIGGGRLPLCFLRKCYSPFISLVRALRRRWCRRRAAARSRVGQPERH
ncbi:M14 family metallopeptidase [Nocardia sp. KC 131]|uniref:M14 family metallopeptidase n=1 Tax=Nocardia arseniciresistens TaxID=3392119 RepID=UPI00398EE275